MLNQLKSNPGVNLFNLFIIRLFILINRYLFNFYPNPFEKYLIYILIMFFRSKVLPIFISIIQFHLIMNFILISHFLYLFHQLIFLNKPLILQKHLIII